MSDIFENLIRKFVHSYQNVDATCVLFGQISLYTDYLPPILPPPFLRIMFVHLQFEEQQLELNKKKQHGNKSLFTFLSIIDDGMRIKN